ncbi:MAG: hypothetical protein HY043_14090 [Verrucomicrobia bacterium]|nr:hypothetical protein [Verrucomicrobiota bacterium]
MNWPNPHQPFTANLSLREVAIIGALAVVAFHLAYEVRSCAFVIWIFLFGVAQLARARSPRLAFYPGLVIGLAIYAPQAGFFWNIFGAAAIALWLVLAFWLGIFALTARLVWQRWNPMAASLLVPVVWAGIEYFRSELYYLRFTWLNAGYAFVEFPRIFSSTRLGVYGVGFVLMLTACALWRARARTALRLSYGFLAALALATNFFGRATTPAWERVSAIQVAGLSLGDSSESELLKELDRTIQIHPDTELILLNEYAFVTPPPEAIKHWCRAHKRHLVAGGKDFISENVFFNTAFVIDDHGEIVFRQAKSVPVQFFDDGLPARQQQLWNSPWGKIGICICYDLSYRRVTDRLIRLGAQALLVPTNDELHWGRHEHELHARVARTRAAEFGVPIFRVGSCGIPQLVDAGGQVQAAAVFSSEPRIITGELRLAPSGICPLDTWLAPAASALTALLLIWFCGEAIRAWRLRRAVQFSKVAPV